MAGTKTNERPGTRAQASYVRSSAYKAREVLDLIRGKSYAEAAEILQFSERGISEDILRCSTRQSPTPSTTTTRSPRSSTFRPATPTRVRPSSAGALVLVAVRLVSASAPATSRSS